VLAGDLAFSAVLGWWGVLSLFINAGVVIAQIQALAEAGRLAAPAAGASRHWHRRPRAGSPAMSCRSTPLFAAALLTRLVIPPLR
jgi:hypothetical protein